MQKKDSYTINIGGELMDLSHPVVMGILNVTPDSFYAGSRMQTETDIANRVEQIIREGAAIIDVGAYSSRPGAEHISADEEMARLATGLDIIRRSHPDAIVSVDTFRADVARQCVNDYQVNIINDISGGQLDDKMFETVAELGVPYILMHMKSDPQHMQDAPHYDNLMAEMYRYFGQRIQQLCELGQKDIILDPGFGFAKTLEHNYHLMAHMEELQAFHLPILVGISRKSMIYRLLDSSPEQALNGTSVLNTMALERGASILRVHDVKECVEAVRIYEKMNLEQ